MTITILPITSPGTTVGRLARNYAGTSLSVFATLWLFFAATACTSAASADQVNEATDEIYAPAPDEIASIPELHSRTASIAVADQLGTNPQSTIVVGYEQEGISAYSYATQPLNVSNSLTWSRHTSVNWPPPPDPTSDGYSFLAYEGSPTVLAPHQEHGSPSDALHGTFVYVSKTGTVQNGSQSSGSGSTDVAIIVGSSSRTLAWSQSLRRLRPSQGGKSTILPPPSARTQTASTLAVSGSSGGRSPSTPLAPSARESGSFGKPGSMTALTARIPTTRSASPRTSTISPCRPQLVRPRWWATVLVASTSRTRPTTPPLLRIRVPAPRRSTTSSGASSGRMTCRPPAPFGKTS